MSNVSKLFPKVSFGWKARCKSATKLKTEAADITSTKLQSSEKTKRYL